MFIEPFSLKTSQSNLIDDLDSVVAAMSYFPHVRPASQVVDFICLFVASTAVKVLKSVRLKFCIDLLLGEIVVVSGVNSGNIYSIMAA